MDSFLMSKNELVGKNKIFFLHIPKTAGTSINDMLAENYKGNRVKFHIENDRSEQFRNIKTNELDMFSGHVRLFEVKNYLDVDDFLCVTLLRDPFHQLISHINWVKFISEKPRGIFFGNHPKPIKELSLAMRKIDFTNLSEVESYFTNLPEIGEELFNNCQTRYLLNDCAKPKLTIEDAAQAIESLSFFDIIGNVDYIEIFMNEISSQMQWTSKRKIVKKNVSKTRSAINRDMEGLREVLYPLYAADQVIYDHIFG